MSDENENVVGEHGLKEIFTNPEQTHSNSNKYEGDFPYSPSAPSIVETTSGGTIFDLELRNLNSLDHLSLEDVKNLSEKTYTKICLAHNKLEQIPNGFISRYKNLEMLRILDLSCNQIEFLPNDIGVLQNLTHLNLYENKLKCLPSSLGKLTHLQFLNLDKNPDLFKTSYFRILCGPQSNDKECFTCAKNVTLWINQVTERRLLALRYENVGQDLMPIRDGHLIQNPLTLEQEIRLKEPIQLTRCSKFKRCCCWFLICIGFAGYVCIGVFFFIGISNKMTQ